MQKNKKLIILLIIGLFVGVVIFIFASRKQNFGLVQDRQVISWQINKQKLRVEVVKTPESIAQGLGRRPSLEKADGMLFVFAEPVNPVFWMKDMRFAIDLYWIREGKIIGVERNLQPPLDLNDQEDLPKYYSPGLVDMVLEIPVSKNLQLFDINQ
ncbi:MAG: DUF192 domain-containing protein [Patescibacteria group bacterium]